MSGYTKLFSDIITSSIWNEDDKTRIVWITLLALSDARGYVRCALPSLSLMARVKEDECEKAVIKLESPDKYSRTIDHDGRRIRKIEGGWIIINYEKHRNRLSDNHADILTRERVRRYRERCKSSDDAGKPLASEVGGIGGDDVHRILKECPMLMGISYEQDLRARQCWPGVDYKAVARLTVTNALMLSKLEHPAAFWKKQLEKEFERNRSQKTVESVEKRTERTRKIMEDARK